VDSYYEGQGRPSLAGREPSRGAELLSRMREAGVLCCDMETETVLTLSLLFGIRAGSILAVHGNRATGQWLLDYREAQEQLVRAALEALPELSELAPAAASGGP